MTTDLVLWGTLFGTLLAAVLRASAPIVLAALGGLVSDLAGSVNVALEGIMLVTAFFGVVASAYSAIWFPDAPLWVHPWVGFTAGLTSGVLIAGLLAVFHLELGADIIVAGIGINILAAGLTVFLLVSITGDKGSTATLTSFALPLVQVPFVNAIPVLGAILNGDGGTGHNVIVYISLMAAPTLAWLLYRTRFGLRLRAVGENPDAALVAGISVKRIQYAALSLGGLLASLGGLFLGMGYLTLFQADMTGGRGFLALAAVFLGGRRPLGTLIAALMFGASTVFAARLGGYNVPSQIVFMIPPLLTVVALVLFNVQQKRKANRRIARAATPFGTPEANSETGSMTKITHEDRILGALLLADFGGTPGAATELWEIDEIVARFGGPANLFGTPRGTRSPTPTTANEDGTVTMAEQPVLSANTGRLFDLLAYGDPNVDYVFGADRIPPAGEKMLGRNLGVFPGGTVANVACAASRLGTRSASYGRVGDDDDGRLLLQDNEAFGVSNAFVSIAPHRTSAAMIMVEASGEKALIYAPMPAASLDETRLTEALKDSRVVYAMPYDIEEFRRVSTLARQCGTDVAIDIEAAVAPDKERLDALLGCSDIVFMNAGGFRVTCGNAISSETIRPLLSKGPRLAVVTMGADGAIAVTAGDFAARPAFPAQMIDATGAGDCFNGAFIAALTQQRSLAECLTFACAAASIAVSAMGARTAIPERASVNVLMRTGVRQQNI